LQYEDDYLKKLKENYSKEEIKEFLSKYRPFTPYHQKRLNILKKLLFDEDVKVEGLEWIM
jgi:hypothetical protein